MLDLRLRAEFQGRRLKGTTVDLTNPAGTGALDLPAADFLKITYPSTDLLRAVEATGPDRSRPVVLLGARGQGKSHLLAALYHLFTSPAAGRAWLADWSVRLGRPELEALPLRTDRCVVAVGLHLHRYKYLWDVLFERHPHGEFFRGKWEGMGDKKPDVPSDLLLVEMLRRQPAVVILDEFQTWFEGLTNSRQQPHRTWAFNFIQILSEIAQTHPDLLTLVVSVRDGNSEAFQQVHRVNPVLVDFQGPAARRDRQRLLLHRIFDNRSQVPDGRIDGLIQPHVAEYLRLAKVPPAEHDRRQEEFREAWPFAPHLLRLLDDQVLIAAAAQETRDLIKILVDVYKQAGDTQPVITAADFSLTNERSGVASLLDSVASELHKDLRTKALMNLDLLRESVPDAARTLPHLDGIVNSLWLRSLTFDRVAGAEPADLQIDLTRGRPLDDNGFDEELATVEESSFNIHRVGTRLVFKREENLRTKLLAHAKNDRLFAHGQDIVHLAKEVRAVLARPEQVSQRYRVVVLRQRWQTDPWTEFDEKERPKAWPADGKLPVLVVPVHPDRLSADLGGWLKSHLAEGRNTVRFLLPARGTPSLYQDRDLVVLARAVYLAMEWKKNEAAYAELERKFQAELAAKLKGRFDRFAVLNRWNFLEPSRCEFEERGHGAVGDKILEKVDEIVRQDLFVPEDIEDYVLQLADRTEAVGRLLRDLREPRANDKPCIPWLGENEIKDRVAQMCAAGRVAINLRDLELLQARPGEAYDDAWHRMKGKLGVGRHLEETTLQRPNLGVSSNGTSPAVNGRHPPANGQPLQAAGAGVVTVAEAVSHTQQTADSGSPPINLFRDLPPPPAKRLLSAPPTSSLNLLGQVERWEVGAATPLTSVSVRVGRMTGAQLQQLIKALPDGLAYSLDIEREA